MAERNFERIDTNGVTLETVVEGDGPLVILLHGWPQCWYLWRHQIDPIANAGFRVAVPNQRGYGGSSAPRDPAAYNIRELAADVVGISSALGYEEFTLIGHDWGCIAAWNTALLHEDTCTAIMGLSVPFWRLSPHFVNPREEGFWYARLFQTVGLAETDLEADIEGSLAGIYYALGGDVPPGTFLKQIEHPATASFREVFPPPEKLPGWLTQRDLDVYVAEFRKSGFHGPNSWYRNIPTNNADTPELEGKRFRQPAAFAAGALDIALMIDPDWRSGFESSFDDLRFVEIIEGAGHWVQMEKPAETNAAILRFLDSLGR
ncbi:MAG: alpha/beta hydrolase [Myxococcales bacterium]|nr:alpha/beta hydrolase [Myxococcales bacterium]